MGQMQGMMENMRGMMKMMGRGSMMGDGRMFLHHLERVMQQFDLTDAQETQVRSYVRTHMKEAIRAKADMQVKMIDLRELLEADTVDLPKVKVLIQDIASQKADLHFAHITLMQDTSKFLTPEQQKTFRSMRRHMTRGGKGMMGRGGMQGGKGMMGRSGMRGKGGMRNPCGMMGRGAGNQ